MPHSLNNYDNYINQALNDWHIPGAAVAVVKGDNILHAGGYGLRDIENELPVTENTRFPIASMTKPFTAMGAALLVDEGLLEWDQPIRDVLPDFRLADEYATAHATLRDLLCHRTGLPRHDATWYGTGKTRRELIKSLRHLKPNASFRSVWQYNNLMYETVGHLCARVTGSENWQQFIQSRILDVLELNSTTPNFDESRSAFNDVAMPYWLKHDHTQPERTAFYEDPLASPAGSMHSTLNDLVRWLKVHTTQGLNNGEQFISTYNLQQMHTPHMLIPPTELQKHMFNNTLFAYGLGWFIEPYRGITVLHHGGNLDGFSLMGAFVPQHELAIVVLTNINAKGLRMALLYESIDRALGFENNDWSQHYLMRDKEIVQAAVKGAQSKQDDRINNAPATHDLACYAGTYCAPGYADIDIKWEENRLWATHYGKWWPLEHYHYDVFLVDLYKPYQEQMQVSFLMDNHGNIASIQVPVEPALNHDVVFKRNAIELNPALQQQLAGTYSYPLEAQQVIIAVKDHKLTMTLTGQAKKVLHCVKQLDGKLQFSLADNAHSVIEFIQSEQGFDQLRIKHPGNTYECSRLTDS